MTIETDLDERLIQKRRERNRKKKGKKKLSKQKKTLEDGGVDNVQQPVDEDDDIEVEYVVEDPPELNDVCYRHFRKIFQAFKPVKESDVDVKKPMRDIESSDTDPTVMDSISYKQRAAFLAAQSAEDDDIREKPVEDPSKISKKKLKKLTRMSVAELKQVVVRPEVVEMHDVCSKDPKLLIHLKAYRNTVPVPRHWCAKRKYLQGKRGFEKPPFDLPSFIKATGIMEMRDVVSDKDDSKTLKQKMRERVRPKVGRIDIDYQKLHDAFFKHQTKPYLSGHGDLYYEGKEFETKLRQKKPGMLSDDLRTSLGMPLGPNADRYPPPWLIAMQRYGPPPAWPNLKIPGLNAPIPEGCSFGYHAGGWGKPPVDEIGRPLYGDVFGQQSTANFSAQGLGYDELTGVDKSFWGELESESESEEEDVSDEDMNEGEEEGPMAEGVATPASGIVSSAAGLETPDMIELRKKAIEESMDMADEGELYKILPEVQASVGDAFMGSSRIYDVPGSLRKRKGDASEVSSQSSSSQQQQQQQQQPSSKRYAKDYKF